MGSGALMVAVSALAVVASVRAGERAAMGVVEMVGGVILGY